MWLHTADLRNVIDVGKLWFDEFLYLWCDYIQLRSTRVRTFFRCDLMNFCIFDVITYSCFSGYDEVEVVVIWWIFVSLMWLHTARKSTRCLAACCDLMNFCIFDVITYSSCRACCYGLRVVIWWIFVSLMWLHTADSDLADMAGQLWFDEFLYLWCDYIQHKYTPSTVHGVVIWWIFVSLMWLHTAFVDVFYTSFLLWFDEFLYLWCDYIQQVANIFVILFCCDLMNFCIFDVITYSVEWNDVRGDIVVIWWIFVSLMWLHTAQTLNSRLSPCCDLMNFCIFDVITYSKRV